MITVSLSVTAIYLLGTTTGCSGGVTAVICREQLDFL